MSGQNLRTSPFRCYPNEDLEAGSSSKCIDFADYGSPSGIPPTDRLKRWRQAALVLNASRRYRYTLDLKKEEEKKQLIAKIRTHAQVIRAAVLFQEMGKKVNDCHDSKGKAKVSKENEINEVLPFSEAKMEEFCIQVPSPRNALGQAKSSFRHPFNACRPTPSIMEIFYFHMLYLTWRFQHHRSILQNLQNSEAPKENSTESWSEQSLALLISVMGIFAGGAYMVPLAFRDVFQLLDAKQFKNVNLSIFELFTFPSAAIDNFLFFTAVTITFVLSMVVIMTAVCFIFRKRAWGTSLTILSLFTIVVFVLSFFAMVSKLVPHSITIAGGYLKVPAILVVIFYDLYVIFIVYALAYIAKGLWSFWLKQVAGVIR